MNEKYLLPVSILIAGLLVGGGLYLSATKTKEVSLKEDKKEFEVVEPKQEEPEPMAVNKERDHILGDYDKAELFIIEYSDTQCPFCKRFHDQSWPRLKEKYLNDDRVAFVYRAFPLGQIHPTAATEAVGLECAAKLGGDKKFFEMKNEIYALTKSNNENAEEVVGSLPRLAKKIGLNEEEFKTCQKDPEMIKRVEDSFKEAVSAGVGGTPTVFVQIKNGKSYNIPATADIIIPSVDKYLEQLEK